MFRQVIFFKSCQGIYEIVNYKRKKKRKKKLFQKMSFQVNKNEIFSYFVYENGKKYYLMQKWFEANQNDNYLKLSLTDCTNYWIKTCKYSQVKI